MYHSAHPFLLTMMVIAIGLRAAFGAPCCMDVLHAASMEASVPGHDKAHDHDQEEPADDGHGDHGDGPSPNPCCSACGPTLTPETGSLALAVPPRLLPQPTPIRALETRPPYPAYDATGPPLLI